ncbi:hypothetical protein [Microbacterium sp. A93]
MPSDQKQVRYRTVYVRRNRSGSAVVVSTVLIVAVMVAFFVLLLNF